MSNTDPTKNTTQKTKKIGNMEPTKNTTQKTKKKDEQHGSHQKHNTEN